MTAQRVAAQIDLFTARRLRDDGMAKVAAAEPDEWTRDADRILRQLLDAGLVFTSDDLCQLVGRRPSRPNACGAFFHRAVKSGRLAIVGRSQSQRPQARGRWLVEYRAA